MHALLALAQLAGPAFVAGLWQGTLLAAALWLCLRFVPRATAGLRFALWTAVLLLVALLPLLESVQRTHPAAHAVVRADPRWSIALAALWLTLSLLRATSLAVHSVRLWDLHRRATPVQTPTSAGGERPVQLCTSTQLDRPGVIGFFRPRILIPAWLYPQLTPPELEQIVLHEREHLRRRDDWLNLLQKLALVLFPLNPILIAVERLLCRERELACDEGVVRRTRAPRLYATCLARLAEHGLDHRALSLTLGYLERQSELARRVTGILRAPCTLAPRQSLALTGIAATLLLAGSAELARCPQLISFAAAPLLATNTHAPERWVSSTGAAPTLYTDAARPRLRDASLQLPSQPIHKKVKARHAHPATLVQRASTQPTKPGAPLVLLAKESPTVAPTPVPSTASITPTLVRYTLVRVEGGWLLLQL